MMPPRNLYQGAATSDLWQQYEPLIRQLYLEQNLTLEQLQEVLERDHSFPPTPLSTYECKVRDVLQLRKKLKKADWPIIYEHWRRLGGKRTHPEVYFHGRHIPWTKAWKEIRRSDLESIASGPVPALPAGIELKLPNATKCHKALPQLRSHASNHAANSRHIPNIAPLSLGLSVNFPTRSQASSPSLSLEVSNAVATRNQHEFPSARLPTVSPTWETMGISPALLHQIDLSEVDLGVMWDQLCIEHLPFFKWLSDAQIYLSAKTHTPGEPSIQRICSRSPTQSSVTLERQRDNLEALPKIFSAYIETLFPQNTLSAKFDIFFYISVAIFRFSDSVTDLEGAALFRIIMEETSRAFIMLLLGSNHLSIRAFWEKMFELSSELEDSASFHMLVIAGKRHKSWMLVDYNLLGTCAELGLFDLLELLLPLSDISFQGDTADRMARAAWHAVRANRMDCARLLMQQFDINRTFGDQYFKKQSIFEECLFITCSSDSSSFMDLISLCLESGADVDAPSMQSLVQLEIELRNLAYNYDWSLGRLRKDFQTAILWPSSVLDRVSLQIPWLYEQLAPHSRRLTSEVTRSSLFNAARHGITSLTSLFESKPMVLPLTQPNMLETVLVEIALRILPLDHEVLSAILRSMPKCWSLPYWMHSKLWAQIVHLKKGIETRTPMKLLKLLMERGMYFGCDHIFQVVKSGNVTLLEVMHRLGADFPKFGTEGLAHAVAISNHTIVAWFIEHGVNINDMIKLPTGRDLQTVLYYAITSCYLANRISPSSIRLSEIRLSEIIGYMTRYGATLTNAQCDPRGHKFLVAWVEMRFENKNTDLNIAAEVDELLKAGITIDQDEFPRLLDACICNLDGNLTSSRDFVLQHLLKRGPPVINASHILASLIRMNGNSHLVEHFLKDPSNVWTPDFQPWDKDNPTNAAAFSWNTSLFEQILKAHPPLESHRKGVLDAALNFACQGNAFDSKERRQRAVAVQMLIGCGADPNAFKVQKIPTALNHAVRCGDFNLILFLLGRGALPNLLCGHKAGSPLDIAAAHGRLDVVQLLLNVGGLSRDPGGSGYDGALTAAKRKGHGAVVELLKQHIQRISSCVPEDF
ncbi:ankyrin repeat domain-containing protein 50 [Microdochium nivale]|nr:ankyrin repeat domain-containing protein 50 [Microdochium nivale]